jgi:hypothetical protein
MENILDEIEKPQFFSDKEIFTKIWINPRDVLRFIHDNRYDKFVTVLLVLAGISRTFDRAVIKNMGDQFSLLAILGICIIMGGLLGWLSYYIYSALISWTGKWLKGEGDTISILRIIAYAMTPSIIALILLIPQIGVYGPEIFKAEGDVTSGGVASNIIFYGSMILELILGIFTIIFCVIGVSEVQKFGIGKAILNLLLPVFVIIVPILILFLIFKGL